MELCIFFSMTLLTILRRIQRPTTQGHSSLYFSRAKHTKFIKLQYIKIYYLILGAQLSSRCLSIEGSSSKCWSILTYPKRHEPSLDIW